MPLPALAAAALPMLLPYLPVIGKAALGLLPTNAAAVVGKVVDTVKTGVAIGAPILRTLDNVVQADATGNDISVAEMVAALAELKTPGVYEAELAKAKAAAAQS